MDNISITFTKSQVKNLVEFFEMAFCQLIADLAKYGELDNMNYLVDMCETYTKLSDALKEAQNETD